jgi:hypothetical protein
VFYYLLAIDLPALSLLSKKYVPADRFQLDPFATSIQVRGNRLPTYMSATSALSGEIKIRIHSAGDGPHIEVGPPLWCNRQIDIPADAVGFDITRLTGDHDIAIDRFDGEIRVLGDIDFVDDLAPAIATTTLFMAIGRILVVK